MRTDIENGKAGALFEDFLREQGTYDETTKTAVKRVSAFRVSVEDTKPS